MKNYTIIIIVSETILFLGGLIAAKEQEQWKKLIETLEFMSPLSTGPKYEQYGCYCFQKGIVFTIRFVLHDISAYAQFLLR